MSATLYYFYHRGRGELIRLTLVAAGIEFKEVNPESREQFLKWIEDGKLMFNQVPLLEIDGKQLVQTGPIIRYIARKDGTLCGKSADDQVTVDMLYEGGRDFTNGGLPFVFQPEATVLDNIKKNVLPKYMPLFEKVAAKSGTGYLVGDYLTIADISVVEGLLIYTEYLGMAIFDGFPALKKCFETVTSVDKMAAYLKSPRRPAKNDQAAIDKVKEVLGRV